MALVIAAAVGVTALVTGIGSYFAFRPSAQQNYSGARSEAQITNDVKVMENGYGAESLILMMLLFLVIFHLIEISVVAVCAFKRSLKRKYSNRQAQLPIVLSTLQQQQQPQPVVPPTQQPVSSPIKA